MRCPEAGRCQPLPITETILAARITHRITTTKHVRKPVRVECSAGQTDTTASSTEAAPAVQEKAARPPAVPAMDILMDIIMAADEKQI